MTRLAAPLLAIALASLHASLIEPCADMDAAVHALLASRHHVPASVALPAIRAEAQAGQVCKVGGNVAPELASMVLDAANRLWDVAAQYNAVMH